MEDCTAVHNNSCVTGDSLSGHACVVPAGFFEKVWAWEVTVDNTSINSTDKTILAASFGWKVAWELKG